MHRRKDIIHMYSTIGQARECTSKALNPAIPGHFQEHPLGLTNEDVGVYAVWALTQRSYAAERCSPSGCMLVWLNPSKKLVECVASTELYHAVWFSQPNRRKQVCHLYGRVQQSHQATKPCDNSQEDA